MRDLQADELLILLLGVGFIVLCCGVVAGIVLSA